MKFRKTALLTLAALFIMAGAMAAQAAVYVPVADLEGSRCTTGYHQITATDGWAGSGGFKIAWDIDFCEAESEYTYKYTITDKDGGDLWPSLKACYLQVAPDACTADFCDVLPDAALYQGVKDCDVPGATDLYAMAWESCDYGKMYISFKTDRMPVWGSFYAKDGWLADAKNYSFSCTVPPENSIDTCGYIPVPDCPVPVPPSFLLLGSGLLGLGVLRFRR